MKENTVNNPLSLAASVLIGAVIGAAAMNSSQATTETPSRLQAAGTVQGDVVYLPALYTEAQRAAVAQPLPAQF